MKLTPKTAMWLVGAAAAISVMIYQAVTDPPGKRVQDGQVVTEIISTAKGDATATFGITLTEGADALHEADHVFDTIQSEAIERASLDISTLDLRVAYDSALIAEGDIRQMLGAKGYLEISAADGVAATLSADGTSQQFSVTAVGQLDPSIMTAKAGIPVTITFSAGSGHLASVKVESLGIEQNITQGGVMELPALQPGKYEFICAEGYSDGTLIVE